MYIGHGSVERTRAFLDGYTFCCGDTDPDYKEFNEWVAHRFSITTTHDWASIISFIGGSEATAFKVGKELWEEYKATKKNE